jgi:thiosulfate/3-mercaptopyruvate sulfurtransferase
MGIQGNFSIRRFYCGAIFSALFAAFYCSAFAQESTRDEPALNPQLVDITWLQARMGAPGVVIVDTRPPGDYVLGHIAGAVSLPSADTFRTRLGKRVAPMSRIEYLLGSRGIRLDDQVILYGNNNYRDAARVLWTLSLFGHTRVALLNGGYTAWKSVGLPTGSHIPPRQEPFNYRATVRTGLMSTRFHMLLALDDPATAIVDTRDAIEYQGFDSQSDRPGHIPTALNIPSEFNLETRQGVLYFKPRPALEELYRDLAGYKKVILYCNNGCQSSTSFLVLRLLGMNVSIYDGGWREWSRDPRLPVEISLQ